MMRFLDTIFATLLASDVVAMTAYRCSAPLVLPYDVDHPQPELVFALMLDDGTTPPRFSATGRHFAQGGMEKLQWAGVWTPFEDGLHMIGQATRSDGVQEWRAEAALVQNDVMILNLERGMAGVLMVRCLTEMGE